MMHHSSQAVTVGALSGGDLIEWWRRGLVTLRAAREHLDDINVFDEADWDTGKNLTRFWALLVDTTTQAAQGRPPMTPAQVLRLCVDAAYAADADDRYAGDYLTGNSVIIVRDALDGMASAAAGLQQLDLGNIADIFAVAAVSARRSLGSEAVNGTILDVFDAAAEAAAVRQQGLFPQLDAVAVAAERAVRGTTRRLAVLRRTGFVDAGALGLSLVLQELPHAKAASELPRSL